MADGKTLIEESIKEYVSEVVLERRLRESEVSLQSGEKVPWASEGHIKDLERRLSELTFWRDKHKKGTDARANYARVITRVRGELNSARRHASRKQKAT